MKSQHFILLLSIAVLILIAMPLMHRLKRDSMQAEAKLMLGYLTTLQRAHFADKKSYKIFLTPYGAQKLGMSQCNQPAEAHELGFYIHNCEASVRYHYIAALDDFGQYVSEAESGSDGKGLSLVCGAQQIDIWQMDHEKEISHKQNCQ
jgi:hypothetical protein